jgi:hypothetical protein
MSMVIGNDVRSYFFGVDPRATGRTIHKDDRCYTGILCTHSIPA